MSADRDERVTVRLSPTLLSRLDRLAKRRGVTRSACLRSLVSEAAYEPAEALPDEGELLSVLAERARAGNVAAIRILLERQAGDHVSEFERLVNARLAGGDRQ